VRTVRRTRTPLAIVFRETIARVGRLDRNHQPLAREFHGRALLLPGDADGEVADERRAHARAWRQRDGQPALRIVPREADPHPRTTPVFERSSVVFEEIERAVRARI